MKRPSLLSFALGLLFALLCSATSFAQVPPQATLLNATTGFEQFNLHQSGDVVHLFGKAHPAPYCRSDNGGRTWSTIEQSLGYFTISDSTVAGDLAAVIGPSYLSTGGPTVAVSNDGGQSWQPSQQIANWLASTLRNQHALAIHANGLDVLALWTESASNSMWAHRSTDGGVTWPGTQVSIGAAPTSGVATITTGLVTVADGATVHVFWLRKVGSDYFRFMQSTTDAGQTWLPAPRMIGTVPWMTGNLKAVGDANTLLLTNGPTLDRSLDGGVTWSSVPLTAMTMITEMAFEGSRVLVIGRTGASWGWVVETSLDGGATWPTPWIVQSTLGGLTVKPHVAVDALYASFEHGSTPSYSVLVRSLDDGATWHVVQHDVNGLAVGPRRNIHIQHVRPAPLTLLLHAYVGLGYTPTGIGTPGTLGVVPRLTMQGMPTPGETPKFEVDDAVGGSLGVLGTSSGAPQAIPFAGGQLWLQAPLITSTFATGGASGMGGSGSASLPLAIPNSPSLAGLSLTAQAAVLDAAANSLFALSNAIEVWVR